MRSKWLKFLIVLPIMLILVIGMSGESVIAQDGPIPLRVEFAIVGTLTSDIPSAMYEFTARESLRMNVAFDVIDGDMLVGVVVYDQDQTTVLAEAAGPNVNGVTVKFPQEGNYFLELHGKGGTYATYRLMIDADPALPINPFVAQSYLVAGTATTCSENVSTSAFTPTEDLNVCFVLQQIVDPITVKVEWWSPSGEMIIEEEYEVDDAYNGGSLLSGIVYQGSAFESGWWQAHILLDGELAFIQWVWVG